MNAKLFRPHQCFAHLITIIIPFLTFSLIIPIHNAQNYSEIYKACSQMDAYPCGKPLKGQLGYPFWGVDLRRPLECGLVDFELWCEDSGLAADIGSYSTYLVVEVNPSAGVLVLNYYDDPLDDICESGSINSTVLYETLYDYTDTTEEIHLFYNCGPKVDPGLTSKLTCLGGDKKQIYFFRKNVQPEGRERFSSCNYTRLPVNKSVLDQIINNPLDVKQLFKGGSIEVQYSIDRKACDECLSADGWCWNGTNSRNNTCLYSNGTVLHPDLHPYPPYSQPPAPYSQPGKQNNSRMIIGIATGLGGGFILILLAVFFFFYRCKKAKQGSYAVSGNVSHRKDVDAFIKQYRSSIPERFRYSTIKKITNSFKDELGKGGFGIVYRGSLSDGRDVAVKVLNATKGNGEEFINEVASIGRTSHVNVVTLLGFCYEGKQRALVYEFMPNGSLEKFIYGTSPLLQGQHLGWDKLFNIAVGIARGLEYLHRGCNTHILHFDIKPHNILLDQDFCPKISDFGLAKLYTTNESAVSSLLQARGTIGYIAPEVANRNFGQVSHKSDVYSYGMMILEMVGGRKNVNANADHTSETYYPGWLYKRIQSDDVLTLANEIPAEENELVRKMVTVGLWCIQTFPSQRPSISKVIEMLEGQTAAFEIPPTPYLCSVPGSPSNSQKKVVFSSSSGTEPTSSLRFEGNNSSSI